MGIPKLKLYRLPSNVSRNETSNATITDIQHAQGDELLPFIPKNLNAYNYVRKLVGIQRVPDNFLRIIRRIQDETGVVVYRVSDDTNNKIVKTQQILVNDWVLSQNNLRVFAANINQPDNWQQIPKTQFRYELRRQNCQGYIGQQITLNSADATEFHDDVYMTVFIGQRFFGDTKNKDAYIYKIHCPRYKDLSNEDMQADALNTTAATSVFGLNKGNIYNGTKTGIYNDFNGIENLDNSTSDSTKNHYYEGNYYYQIKYYPFRIQWIDNTSVDQQLSWNMPDDIDWNYAPVQVFEERQGSLSNNYYQKLTKEQCSIGIDDQDSTKIKIIFDSSYYHNGHFPTRIGIVYNLIGDRLNVNFQQDYQYSNSATPDNALNRGVVFGQDSIFGHDESGSYVLQRKEILAVQQNYGYDSDSDLLLNKNGQTVSFTLPNDKNIVTDDVMIFYNGDEVNESLISVSDKTYTINYQGLLGATIPPDLLISYKYKKRLFDNYNICGIRAIGTIKQQTTDTFIATHPMWVTNHLNQSPDVFVGNTIYSGTSTQSYNADGLFPHYIQHNDYALSVDVGLVELKQPATEMDYNYIVNFAVQTTDRITKTNLSDVLIYLNHITANYAYYDGIYMIYQGKFSCYTKQGGCHYAILTDGLFQDFKYKKFITLGDTSGFYKTFFKGKDKLPNSLSVTDDVESIKLLSSSNDNLLSFSEQHDGRILIKRQSTTSYYNFSYNGVTVQIHARMGQRKGKNCLFFSIDQNGAYVLVDNMNGELTYSGNSIWNIQADSNNIFVPQFENIYDITDSQELKNNMPTVSYCKTDWTFDLCFEVFYFSGGVVYLAVYKKMKGNA